jgi:hypothetical protein
MFLVYCAVVASALAIAMLVVCVRDWDNSK